MTYTVSVLLTGLHSKLWRRARLWLELFASTVDRFLSRVSYFSSETRSLTSKKLYAFLESLCFWSSMHRFIPPLIVLVPQDLYSSLRASLLTVLRVVCHCSAKFRKDHGFDPPCGSHQLLVFLKYSVRPKLLAQLVHRWECKTFCGLAQNSRSHVKSSI